MSRRWPYVSNTRFHCSLLTHGGRTARADGLSAAGRGSGSGAGAGAVAEAMAPAEPLVTPPGALSVPVPAPLPTGISAEAVMGGDAASPGVVSPFPLEGPRPQA